jgi:hypothetical protein
MSTSQGDRRKRKGLECEGIVVRERGHDSSSGWKDRRSDAGPPLQSPRWLRPPGTSFSFAEPAGISNAESRITDKIK